MRQSLFSGSILVVFLVERLFSPANIDVWTSHVLQ